MRFLQKVLALALVTAIAGAVPADGATRDRWTLKNEPYSFTWDGCGFDIHVEGVLTEVVVIREGKHQDEGAFPVMSHVAWQDRYTNPATGDWFTIRGRDTFIETRATRVEGSIFEFRFVQAGQPWVVYDSEGDLVARNRGAVHATYLFDTGGDDEPGGEWVDGSLELIRIAGPHPSFMDDFCTLAVQQIG